MTLLQKMLQNIINIITIFKALNSVFNFYFNRSKIAYVADLRDFNYTELKLYLKNMKVEKLEEFEGYFLVEISNLKVRYVFSYYNDGSYRDFESKTYKECFKKVV